MIILISEPGKVCSLQARLQCFGNYYKDACTRTSVIDGKTLVLDVRRPIIAPNSMVPGQYRLVEGHTRFYEATRQKVGIESFLALSKEELRKLPTECFASLSKRDCEIIYENLDRIQRETIDAGVVYIQDLLRQAER